jgi:hypothetical protein
MVSSMAFLCDVEKRDNEISEVRVVEKRIP